MPKPYKIKHYHRVDNTYKAKPHPLMIILCVVGLAALVYLGTLIYQPLYNIIMGNVGDVLPLPSSSVSSEEPPSAASQEEPTPALVIPASISGMRAVYIPPAIVSDSAALDQFLKDLKGTPINTVMVDLKDNTGAVLYDTANQNAMDWGAVSETPVSLTGLVAKLTEHDLQLVARLSAFRDATAALGDRDNAIHYQSGDWLWLDNASDAGGKPWLNPFAAGARQYISDLAVEITASGAVMVVLDDVQFPDGSGSVNATFGQTSGTQQRQKILQDFVSDSSRAVTAAGGRLALYYPATFIASAAADKADSDATTMGSSLIRFGGSPLALAPDTLVLGLLPSQFGAGYSVGGLELPRPMDEPGATVAVVLSYVQEHEDAAATVIVPLMQGGNEATATTPYTKEQLDSQIAAATQMGSDNYILYQAAGAYLLQ